MVGDEGNAGDPAQDAALIVVGRFARTGIDETFAGSGSLQLRQAGQGAGKMRQWGLLVSRQGQARQGVDGQAGTGQGAAEADGGQYGGGRLQCCLQRVIGVGQASQAGGLVGG